MNHYLVIGAMFKDEAPYLDEWVRFHIDRGVDHLYLYDNGSTDGSVRVLQPFIASKRVTLVNWPSPKLQGSQMHAANDCLRRAKGTSRWMAFLDIDEFLFSPREELPMVLREYEDENGIEVNWACYGSSRHIKKPKGTVLRNFLYRAPLHWQRNRQFKCIVNTDMAIEARLYSHSHLWRYKDLNKSVNELREPLGRGHSIFFRLERWLRNRVPQFHKQLSWKLPLYFNPYSRINRPVSVDRLRINHYIVKSYEEYEEKQARHGVQRLDKYSEDFFRYHDRNEEYDPILDPGAIRS